MEKKIEGYEDLIIAGDIHGNYGEFVHTKIKGKINNSVVIIAGDIGLMEPGPTRFLTYTYPKKMERVLSEQNVLLLAVRGNHDNPLFWRPGNLIDLPHFKTLQDYSVLEVLGKKVLPIGGAQSIDEVPRKEKNEKYIRSGRKTRVWWPTSEVQRVVDYDSLAGKIDIVVSHEAPLGIGPVLYREEGIGEDLYSRIRGDRYYLQGVLEAVKPVRWFFGHYHGSWTGEFEQTRYNGLGIMETLRVIW